jgi:hypothetical protein
MLQLSLKPYSKRSDKRLGGIKARFEMGRLFKFPFKLYMNVTSIRSDKNFCDIL